MNALEHIDTARMLVATDQEPAGDGDRISLTTSIPQSTKSSTAQRREEHLL
jgi:hypothetical protein